MTPKKQMNSCSTSACDPRTDAIMQTLSVIAESCGVKPTGNMIKFIVTAYQDLPLDVVLAGIEKVAFTWEYTKFPPIAVFERAIRGNAEEAMEIQAVDECSHVIDCAVRYGAWKSVEFKNQNTAWAIMHLGGWTKLCGLSEKELPFWRKEFIKAYCQAKRMKLRYEGPLAGLVQAARPIEIADKSTQSLPMPSTNLLEVMTEDGE